MRLSKTRNAKIAKKDANYYLPKNLVSLDYRCCIIRYRCFTKLRIGHQLDEITETLIRNIIGAGIDVHRELGSGFLEKVYERAMAVELKLRNLAFATQVPYTVS